MSVKIGHSSIDENGKIAGGLAGDQTKKEVCTRTYYDKGWHYVLRAKDRTVAEKIAIAVEQACANDNIGYDQNQRNTLWREALKVNWNLSKITVKCECDCSSLVHVAVLAAGINVTYGSNGFTTRTLVKRLADSGAFEKLSDKKYLTSDKYLKRGDIVVREGSHVIVVLEDGAGVDDGKLTVDGEWGRDTTRKSQQVFGTTVDGIVSNQPESCKKYVPNVMITSWEFESVYADYKNGSQFIKAVQQFLKNEGYYTGKVDGHCGYKTVVAIQKFLKEKGYYTGSIDGIMGPNTVKAWQKYINSRL